jgi:hypothetical protein
MVKLLMQGNYIYGVIIGGSDAVLGLKGLAGNSPVYSIAYEGLSGVVSDYAGGNFDSMCKEELACCLLTHQVVVEQVIKKHPVLPMKFGTVLASADEVRELLTQGHAQFFLTLLWIQDKVELEVVANPAGGRVIEEESAVLKALPVEESLPPEGLKLSKTQRRQGHLEKMISFLQPVSIDVQPHPPAPGGGVMSVAFLVDRASLDAFHERVKQLNALFYNQIEFQAVGPLPPYSFVTVEVTRPSQGAIDEAKRLLGLSEVVGEVEVRQACRQLAAEDGARLAVLRRASDLLVAYCRQQPEKEGRFLINIRRSRTDEVQPLRLVEIGA